MLQSWAVQRMAEAHRSDLVESARSLRVKGALSRAQAEMAMPSTLEAAPQPVRVRLSDPRTGHLPLAHQIGNWLIRAGTRLGGASSSIRTS